MLAVGARGLAATSTSDVFPPVHLANCFAFRLTRFGIVRSRERLSMPEPTHSPTSLAVVTREDRIGSLSRLIDFARPASERPADCGATTASIYLAIKKRPRVLQK